MKIFCLIAALLPITLSAQGMIGRYAFLTSKTLPCESESETRQRIQLMVQRYGIRELQFYDWFADYSTPIRTERWTDAWAHQNPICLRTIEAAIDEIHRQRARAWAYVQAVGAEESTWANAAAEIFPLLDGAGQWHWHVGRFPCYFANAAWAKHQVAAWAPLIRAMRFDGIHWDSLGAIAGDYGAESAGWRAFLSTAADELSRYGLAQTFNFVDRAWWDDETIQKYLAFPYAEVWSAKSEQDYFRWMDQSSNRAQWGAIAYYATVDTPTGLSVPETLIARFHESARHHLHYIALGDGERRVVREYWPETVELSPAEKSALRVAW